MPTVSPPLPATPPRLLSEGYDWGNVPPTVARTICDRLDADVRVHTLANVSSSWHEAAFHPSFDESARALLAHGENVPPQTLSVPGGSPICAAARELQSRGLPHAALLVDLHATCARLPTVSPDHARYDVLPDVTLANSTVLLPAGGEPALVAYPADGDDLVLLSCDGTQRTPRALVGVTELNSPRLTVTDACLSAGAMATTCVVRTADGALALFDSTCDVLRPLPAALQPREEQREVLSASVSRDRRYVAVRSMGPKDDTAHLRVHDLVNDRPVTRTILQRDVLRQTVDVDTAGTAMIGGPQRYEIKAGEDGRAVARTALPSGFNAIRFTPDERCIVAQHHVDGTILLEDRHTGQRTTLEPPSPAGSHNTLAFSPGMALALATYGDGSLAIFDLLSRRDHAHALHPSFVMHVQGAGRPRPFGCSTAWFDRDGGGVHAAYPIVDESSGSLAVGLMHLRFD